MNYDSMNGDMRRNTLQAALDRALRGDFTGHENCGPDGCNVVDSFKSDSPFGPGNPLRNYIINSVAVPDEVTAAAFSLGISFAIRYLDTAQRAWDAINQEAGNTDPLDCTSTHDGIKQVLDEHYPVDA